MHFKFAGGTLVAVGLLIGAALRAGQIDTGTFVGDMLVMCVAIGTIWGGIGLWRKGASEQSATLVKEYIRRKEASERDSAESGGDGDLLRNTTRD